MQHFTPAPFTTNYSSRVFLMSLEVSQVKHTMCGIVTVCIPIQMVETHFPISPQYCYTETLCYESAYFYDG